MGGTVTAAAWPGRQPVTATRAPGGRGQSRSGRARDPARWNSPAECMRRRSTRVFHPGDSTGNPLQHPVKAAGGCTRSTAVPVNPSRMRQRPAPAAGMSAPVALPCQPPTCAPQLRPRGWPAAARASSPPRCRTARAPQAGTLRMPSHPRPPGRALPGICGEPGTSRSGRKIARVAANAAAASSQHGARRGRVAAAGYPGTGRSCHDYRHIQAEPCPADPRDEVLVIGPEHEQHALRPVVHGLDDDPASARRSLSPARWLATFRRCGAPPRLKRRSPLVRRAA